MSDGSIKLRTGTEVFEDGEARLLRRTSGEQTPITLPWPSLAAQLHGGLWPGLYLLTGPIASGKTQAALQVSLTACTHGTPVLVCAPALDSAEISARALAVLHRDRWTPAGLSGQSTAAPPSLEAYRDLALEMLVEASGVRQDDVFDAVRDFSRRRGDDKALVVIEEPHLDAARLGAFARELVQTEGASILIVGTAGPGRDDRSDPLMHPLAEAADAVFHLSAAQAGRLTPPTGSVSVDLVVAKHRFGPSTQIALRFFGGWFEEDAHDLELELSEPS